MTVGWSSTSGSDPAVLLACALAVVLGALVQGVLGFGLALLAVPVLAWLAPETVPVGILVAVLPLVVVTAARERSHIDLRGIGWALVGRLPGGTAGAVAVAVLPVRGLQLLVAGTVGLAVVAAVATDSRSRAPAGPDEITGTGPGSAGGPTVVPAARPAAGTGDGPPKLRRTTLALAGALSGLGGTTSGIGGPPMGLAFRNAGGPAIRSTLAVFFVVGALLSLGSLAVVGEVTVSRLLAGLLLVPPVAVGYLLSGWLRPRVRARALRSSVLVLSALSATVLLVAALRG